MAKAQDIKRRIKSIGNTRQLTRAMKMVSASKLRRAQQRILAQGELVFRDHAPDGIHPNALGCETVVTPGIIRALGLERQPVDWVSHVRHGGFPLDAVSRTNPAIWSGELES